MEYLLKKKIRQNNGFVFSSNDPFASLVSNYSCSFSTLLISSIISNLHRDYEVRTLSANGGIDIDCYSLDSLTVWDKNRKLMHNKKANTLTLFVENGLTKSSRPTWDKSTNSRILTLDMRLQNPAREFINTVEEELGIQLRIVQALRTTAQQDSLYNIGRTTPGEIVTKARGGLSYHNYALAIDVVIIKNGQAVWTVVPNDVVKIGERLGFEWGGTWKRFKDYPHFQMTFGKSIRDLRSAK